MNSTNARLLLVEDDPALARGLADNLRFEGYAVEIATTGEVALQLWKNRSFDLVLLDLMLPGISGFDVLRQCADPGISADARPKVVVVSARDEETDIVRALDLGAHDYVKKPFGLGELLARVRAHLRAAPARNENSHTDLDLGGAVLSLARFRIVREGVTHLLSHTEVRMLECLLSEPGKPRSRRELLDHAWGESSASGPRTVDNFVLKLRKKLEPDPANPRFLRTVHGVGYVLREPAPEDRPGQR